MENKGIEIEDGAPDRVILQDEVKLYRTKAVLAFLDSKVFNFNNCQVDWDNPTPVYSEDKRLLGYATVSVEGEAQPRVVAEIAIDYASEERLMVETHQGVKLYPRVFGAMSFDPASQYFFDFTRPLKPTRLLIQGIQLSRKAPADGRLLAFGTPTL